MAADILGGVEGGAVGQGEKRETVAEVSVVNFFSNS